MMFVGASQIDITPQPGVELAGFAVRRQPSESVCDPLAVRGLCLTEGAESLLWLHADLLSLDDSLVAEMREWIERELHIPASRVLLAATHTHSAPTVMSLNCCGKKDPAYIAGLKRRFQQAAWEATSNREPCQAVAVEGEYALGIDRRGLPSAHADPYVGAVGLRRDDGTFKAVLLSYAMHPVCLCDTWISADWPGETARVLSQALPGRPTVLVSSGASGNIDPPRVGVDPEQMRAWGAGVAMSVLEELSAAENVPLPAGRTDLQVASAVIPLPLENWTAEQIHAHADRCQADARGHREFAAKFSEAIETWRETMLRQLPLRELESAEVELFAVSLGGTVFLAANAELFSHFTDLVRRGANRKIYAVGCANGSIGYIPVAAAYDDGAYEVEWAMLFYNQMRPRRGGLELLADHARKLTAILADPPNH